MLVEKWMTKNPVPIEKDASIASAMRLMKEKGLRRLPVTHKGKLVGIVTDRDIRQSTPSKATSLDIWELHFLLEKAKVADVMTSKPVTITPDTTIERAALIMLEGRFEGLPVLNGRGALVGILTQGDVFKALVEVTGVAKKKARVSLLIPDKAGTIKQVADICRENGGRIFSILTSYAKVPPGTRELIMRIDSPDTERLRRALSSTFRDVVVKQD